MKLRLAKTLLGGGILGALTILCTDSLPRGYGGADMEIGSLNSVMRHLKVQ